MVTHATDQKLIILNHLATFSNSFFLQNYPVVNILAGTWTTRQEETTECVYFAFQPDPADYDRVPIDDFGFAMLRGMGWKTGQGLGKNNE